MTQDLPDWRRALALLRERGTAGVTTAEGNEILNIVDWRRRLTEIRVYLRENPGLGEFLDDREEPNQTKQGKHKRYFLRRLAPEQLTIFNDPFGKRQLLRQGGRL